MNGVLLDENLPVRLTFQPSVPVYHATQLGSCPSDSQIWHYARENELAVVTKDADFIDRILITTPPPWIVHLRFGNLRRQDFHAFLGAVWPQVESLLPQNKLVCVYLDRIEAFE
jgi:predicted nuclease of predicted toxin-antitoxin system